MNKILLLGHLLILIIFIIISYNSKSEILENKVNDNIDKKEDFASNSVTRYYFIPTCPVCFELVAGVC